MLAPTRITLQPAGDLVALRDQWAALQARADASAFQTAAWVFCLAPQRLADAVVVRAERDGELVGLALACRRRGALFLQETGRTAFDAVYVEHNAPLLARGHEDLATACLGALLRAAGPGGLRLSGIGPAVEAALPPGAARRVLARHQAPFVALDALDPGPEGYLASLSRNTRQQLRRSERSYAQSGPVQVQRARDAAEGLDYLDALAALHQAWWIARGKPGAFANPAFRDFQRALVTDGVPLGLVELLRVTAGKRSIGYLYNLRHGDRVCAYQSGFDYAGAAPHEKPGLTCHHAAIELARAEGVRVYDFLAGGDRYKISLSNRSGQLSWLQAAPAASLGGVFLSLRGLFS
jgi:CelD/BcsL family acetyltransferase involved in cellulose biosynthesis